MSRSLTGAWIETQIDKLRKAMGYVAPLRGRGLKLGLTICWLMHLASLPYGGVD